MAEHVERAPIFRLALGANGGELAPYTADELQQWIQHEVDFWAWALQSPGYIHRGLIDNAYSHLQHASAAAHRYGQGSNLTNELGDVTNRLNIVFVETRLPHSSTPLAKLVEELRTTAPERATAFLFPHLANPQGIRFEAPTHVSWHGYLLGLVHQFGGITEDKIVAAQTGSINDMNARALSLLAERRNEYDQLRSDLSFAHARGQEQIANQQNSWGEILAKAEHEHADAINTHTSELEAIRKAYQEAMALRAPVDYWKQRAAHHQQRSFWLTFVVLAAFLFLTVSIYIAASWAIGQSPDPTKPDPWRLVVVGAAGVLGIWLLRILVRMFLSDLHLSTDAQERVTMVQTYLALVEGDKLPKDEDRKLVLQPLFRPGSDGMVKDEGLPHPMLDWFTRAGR